MSTQQLIITAQTAGERLDQVLANHDWDGQTLTRSRAQKLIVAGEVLVNGEAASAHYLCKEGDEIECVLGDEAALIDKPENIPINIVYEDDDLMIINKAAGLTVHPGNGQKDGTLLNALLYHRSALANVARAGIVHRLDKETSGLMVIAKSAAIRLTLMEMIANREVRREYMALCQSSPKMKFPKEGTINLPIGRDLAHRTRMAIDGANAREAVTHYRIIESFSASNDVNTFYHLVHCKLATGRTHQIRVHLSHLGLPIVGDFTYNRFRLEPNLGKIVSRQMLHAFFLQFPHPNQHQAIRLQVELPEDFMHARGWVKNNIK